MAKRQDNIFGSFTEAVLDRQREQAEIKAVAVKGETSEAPMRKRGPNATTMTLAISGEDKAKLKAFAARNYISVSDLLHMWIERYCTDENLRR